MSLTVSSPADVAAALTNPALGPHRSSDSSTGSTLWLRAAMARFSSPLDHEARRAAVVGVVTSIDVEALRATAHEATAARLVGGTVEVFADIALVVPTVVLWQALGLPGPAAVADVEAVVRVIGRGESATPAADSATDRLLAIVDVATVSALYQNFDATAALIATSLAGGAPPVPRTRRVAVADTSIGGRAVPAASEVTVEIGAAGLPYGAGPHECPGRAVAESIAAGAVNAIAACAYRIDPSATVLDADGRPTHLVARRLPR